MAEIYYQLLCGQHQNEYGQNFKAGDILKSSRDLVRNFGSFRFRRLTKREIELIEQSEIKEPESKSDICGKCTSEFPDAIEKKLFVYRNLNKKYFVMDKHNTVIANDITKTKLVKFIRDYKVE